MVINAFKYIVSVDIGKQNDYTAISLIERVEFDYHLVKILRWRHSSHEKLISELQLLLADPRMKDGQIAIILDATGVGLAVCDFVRSAGIQCFDLTIHGGYSTKIDGWHISAAKNDIVFSLQNVIEKERLKVNPNLKYWKETKAELETFSPKVNETTLHVSYEAIRSRDHDDLVMSLAMSALFGERLYPAVEPIDNGLEISFGEPSGEYVPPFKEVWEVDSRGNKYRKTIINPDYLDEMPIRHDSCYEGALGGC